MGADTMCARDAYHGYWAQDIYALNSHYGTEQDLRDLSAALHSRGMVRDRAAVRASLKRSRVLTKGRDSI